MAGLQALLGDLALETIETAQQQQKLETEICKFTVCCEPVACARSCRTQHRSQHAAMLALERPH